MIVYIYYNYTMKHMDICTDYLFIEPTTPHRVRCDIGDGFLFHQLGMSLKGGFTKAGAGSYLP